MENSSGKQITFPEWLYTLKEALSDNMSTEQSKIWSEKLLEAIYEGADLEKVKHQFCAFLIEENIERVKLLENLDEQVSEQVLQILHKVLELHMRYKMVTDKEWATAKDAAWSIYYNDFIGYGSWCDRNSAVYAALSAGWCAALSDNEHVTNYAAEYLIRYSANSAGFAAAKYSTKDTIGSNPLYTKNIFEYAESTSYLRYSEKLLELLKNS